MANLISAYIGAGITRKAFKYWKMSEESKELELVEKRLDVLERTLFGNGNKGLKAELVELKTQIETFKRIAVWQIGILVAIFCAVLKNIW